MSVDTSTVSFAHDGRIVVNGWPLSKTSRDCSPFVADIASIVHENNVGIYATVLAHTDWVPDADTTAPNIGGAFTVTGVGGSLTLTLPSNYEDRLGVQVPALNGPEGIPTAYITRRHDYYIAPWAPNPEPAESVYAWLGWGYLYVGLNAPEATTVTATVSYYDADTHEDTHVTDASRQTDYSFATGELTTLEYMTPIAAGLQTICIDLATDNPMRIVKSLKLEFGAVGDWTLGEPVLGLDGGDSQANPPRAAVVPHLSFKEFEHWEYKRGGASACVDGQFLEAIAWPDTSHQNTIPEPTGGHFDYVVGAVTGIDQTSAWTLQQFMSLIRRCSDAWDTSYTVAAAETAFKDEDDVWLKTPDCFDLRPVNLQTDTAFDVAVRVGEWATPPGLHYDWCAEKIVEGQGHGWAQDGAGNRARNKVDFGSLWQRELGSPDDWAKVQDLSSDGHGHWHSDSQKVVAEYIVDAATLWEYGVGNSAANVTSMGSFATREYAVKTAIAFALQLHLLEADLGPLYLTDSGSGNVGFRRRLPGETWGGRHLAPDTTDASWACSVQSRAQGPNLVRDGALGNYMRQAISHNGEWLPEKLLHEGYSRPDAIYYEGRWYTSAYKDGQQWMVRCKRHGDYDVVDTAVIADSEAVPACLCIPENYGRLLCAVQDDADVKVYSSGDLGKTWGLKWTYAGWSYPRLFAFWNALWLVAFREEANDEDADGQLYITRRNQSTAALDAWPFADGTATAVVGPSDAARAGFVSRYNAPALVVAAVKAGPWTNDAESDAAEGFVQYDSGDGGMSWALEGVYSYS